MTQVDCKSMTSMKNYVNSIGWVNNSLGASKLLKPSIRSNSSMAKYISFQQTIMQFVYLRSTAGNILQCNSPIKQGENNSLLRTSYYGFVSNIFVDSLNVEKRCKNITKELCNKGVEYSLHTCWPRPRQNGSHVGEHSSSILRLV